VIHDTYGKVGEAIEVRDLQPGMVISFQGDVLKITATMEDTHLGEIQFHFEKSSGLILREMSYRIPPETEVTLLWGSHLSEVREPGKRYFLGWEDAAGTIAKYEQDGEQFKVRSTRTVHSPSRSCFDVISSRTLTVKELKGFTDAGPFGFKIKGAPLSDISVEKGFTHAYDITAYTD